MSVGTEEFNWCRCLCHARISPVSCVSAVDNSSIAQGYVLFVPFSPLSSFQLSGRDLYPADISWKHLGSCYFLGEALEYTSSFCQ